MIHGRRQLYGTMMRDAASTFKLIDKDGSGGLDYTEFAQAMKRLGLGLDASQTTELARMMDTDGDGEISAEEFVAALAEAKERAAAGPEQEEEEHEEHEEEEVEPEQEVVVAVELKPTPPPPRPPTVAEMTPKQRIETMFKAVTDEDEETILRLLAGGVRMDVTRTDRMTMKEETPMEVAVELGKQRSIDTLVSAVVQEQQQLVCDGLHGRHQLLEGFLSKVAKSSEFRQREMIPLRPWRNSKAVEECTEQLEVLSLDRKTELTRVLTRRAKLYIDAHAMANAVADYTAVIALCPLDPEAEFDDLLTATLIRRGVVFYLNKQDQRALTDLEHGWSLFKAKREALRVAGDFIYPTSLLDRAAHLIHTIKFRLHMKGIDRGSDRAILKARQEHGLPPVSKAELSDEEENENDDATTTGSKSPRAWANAKSLATQQVRQAAKGTSGVSLIWLVEWGIRNEIDGYAEWFVRCAKGQRTVEAVSFLPFKSSSAFSSSLFADLCSGLSSVRR